MKAVLLALVLGTVAPLHVAIGPVSLPVSWLLIAAEAIGGIGGTWLAVRIIRESRPRRLAGGAW